MYNDLFLLYSQRLVFQGWILSFEYRSIKAIVSSGVSKLHVLLFYAGHVHTVEMQYHPIIPSVGWDLTSDRQHVTMFVFAYSICHIGHEACQMISG